MPQISFKNIMNYKINDDAWGLPNPHSLIQNDLLPALQMNKLKKSEILETSSWVARTGGFFQILDRFMINSLANSHHLASNQPH